MTSTRSADLQQACNRPRFCRAPYLVEVTVCGGLAHHALASSDLQQVPLLQGTLQVPLLARACTLRSDPTFVNQAFEHEQRAKHVVIRRTISSLADGFSFRVDAHNEDEQLGWSQYVTLTLNLIEVYQTQQASIVYPAARNITRNARLLAVEENEHGMLHDIMRWWDAARQPRYGEPGLARLTQQLVVETKQKFATLQRMMCSRGGHLEREAKVRTSSLSLLLLSETTIYAP